MMVHEYIETASRGGTSRSASLAAMLRWCSKECHKLDVQAALSKHKIRPMTRVQEIRHRLRHENVMGLLRSYKKLAQGGGAGAIREQR